MSKRNIHSFNRLKKLILHRLQDGEELPAMDICEEENLRSVYNALLRLYRGGACVARRRLPQGRDGRRVWVYRITENGLARLAYYSDSSLYEEAQG